MKKFSQEFLPLAASLLLVGLIGGLLLLVVGGFAMIVAGAAALIEGSGPGPVPAVAVVALGAVLVSWALPVLARLRAFANAEFRAPAVPAQIRRVELIS